MGLDRVTLSVLSPHFHFLLDKDAEKMSNRFCEYELPRKLK